MSDIASKTSYLTLIIPFPDERLAAIAYRTLSVDKEPTRGGVNKTLSVDGNELKV
ncbi:hypothetical protein RvY_06903 [Ramazzottius varieornatus]|uniref:Uncharacterized protein n=1 Tax=Ramazzottius varieornatus TaxID=947166 RepID=A0A1D1V3G9_RAMVA|nr:hypothetical protein RvY_06903 [Ramazzottius varieornatus]